MPHPNPIANEENKRIEIKEEIIEKLADIEHQRWIDWQKYLHSKCRRNSPNFMYFPIEDFDRWERQIATPYSELTEKEKDSDRHQVERYLPIIKQLLLSQRQELEAKLNKKLPREKIPSCGNKDCMITYGVLDSGEYCSDCAFNSALSQCKEIITSVFKEE
jgi:hypothetical protein